MVRVHPNSSKMTETSGNAIFDAIQYTNEDNNGMVLFDEIKDAILKADPRVDENKLIQALNNVDPDQTGKIEKLKLVQLWGIPANYGKPKEKDKIEVETKTIRPKTQGNLRPKTPLTQRTRLLEVKVKRKQAEYDAQLLKNRIMLLEQEEAKAWKKIDQTKNRAKEIVEQRTVIQKRAEERHYQQFVKEKATKIAQKKKNSFKHDSIIKKKNALTNVTSKKLHEVELIRKERQKLKMEKEKQLLQDVKLAKQSREEVRNHELKLKLKREKEKKKNDKKVTLRYLKRVQQEEILIREQEDKVKNMEKAEMELIQRLQNAQMVQRKAYEELEKTLMPIS